MIEVKNLYKSFEDKEVLKDINATFHNGQVNLIIGQSGSGKSTLIKAAIGLLGPAGMVTRGDIWYQGKNLPDLKPAEIRKLCGPDFGMIFQSAGASFCPIRTVGAQLFESVREHEEMTK